MTFCMMVFASPINIDANTKDTIHSEVVYLVAEVILRGMAYMYGGFFTPYKNVESDKSLDS